MLGLGSDDPARNVQVEESLRVIKAVAEGLAIEAVIGLPFANCDPCLYRVLPAG